MPILGDAKLVLAQLVEAVKERLGKKKRADGVRKEIEKHKTAWLRRWEAKRRSQERPINPYFVMSEFMRVIPSEDAIVTHDSGSPRDQLLPFYVATKPRGFLGMVKSLTPDEMKRLLLANIKVSDEDLHHLAEAHPDPVAIDEVRGHQIRHRHPLGEKLLADRCGGGQL